MIFYLVYFPLLIVTLTCIPFIVFRYVMIGDEYLLISSPFYSIFWIISLLFLFSYFWNTIRYFYDYIVSKKNTKKFEMWSTIRSIHSIIVGSVYSSIYMTILGFIGYILGLSLVDNLPELREFLMAFVHIPQFEYVIKGLPLTVGALLGQLMTTWCVNV